ncbi:MAG: PQQ-binding-like beta-propeller repeat protein [Planctomycetaceae bacterium]
MARSSLTAILIVVVMVYVGLEQRRQYVASRDKVLGGFPPIAAGRADRTAASLSSFTDSSPTPVNPPRRSSVEDGSRSFRKESAAQPQEPSASIIWSRKIGTGYSAPVVADGRLILVHRCDDEEVVSCFNCETGEPLWEHRYGTAFECEYPTYSSGPYSTPVTGDAAVCVQSAEGGLRCLSLSDGTLIWSRDLTQDYGVELQGYGVAHSPLLDHGRLFLNLGGTIGHSAVVALDAETGETIWTSGVSARAAEWGLSCATPVSAEVDGSPYLLVLASDALYCLNPDDGAILDRFKAGAHNRTNPNATTPLVVGDLVLLSICLDNCWCLRIQNDGQFQEVWQNKKTLQSLFNPLSFVDGCVYGWNSFDKTLRCIDLQTGAVLWKERTEFARGSQAVADGKLFVIGEFGEFGVIAVNGAKYEKLFSTVEPLLKAPCFSRPALSNGRLYLRNEETLICLDLRQHPAGKRAAEFSKSRRRFRSHDVSTSVFTRS